MPQLFPRHNRSGEPLMRRLDRAAGLLNPLLMMIAIGLALLNVSCLITLLDTGSLAVHRSSLTPPMWAPPAGATPN
jgi:hypothetical protein